MGTHMQEFRDVLSHFDTAMLVTQEPDGRLRARPMAIADSNERGEMWFVTSLETDKTRELVLHPQIAAVMQGQRRYLSIAGEGRLVIEPRRIRDLWRESWRVWFPEGPDDPRICLIHLEPQEAEYWDVSGLKRLRYVFEAARAYVEGTSLDGRDAGRHGRVDL